MADRGTLSRLSQAAADPGSAVRRLRPRNAAAAMRAAALATRRDTLPTGAVLPHAQALQDNGFTVFRGLIPALECARLAARMKEQAGIQDGVEYTRVDATNKFNSTRDVLFDDRVLDAVRTTIGSPVRFLQVSDLHYLHDTVGWHRDSVHRAPDSSAAPDWDDAPFGVVKAILYLESDNAGMGMMAGSHLSPMELDRDLVRALEKRSAHIVIDTTDEPNRRFAERERRYPVAWKAGVGDVLVFDERMYHGGRRVQDGRVNSDVGAAKFTLSLVFGRDTLHAVRLYSYFRYARLELHYRDFPSDFRSALADRDLILEAGLGNFYEQHVEELRMVHLRKPETLDSLVEQFSRGGRRSVS